MLPAAPPPVASVAAARDAALHKPAAAGASDVAVAEGDGGVVAVGDGGFDVADADGADADGVEEVGGAVLVPDGLGLGPQAARRSSAAAAVVVTRPVLMR
ncbi:hypothetical protein AAU01_16470 [Paenarthrobacter aurescens]|uniref:Uncharacterized protein n=1 Tax=Paenarthrobacter aurescens TaxID=43663 RepID=A0A4Y3NB64_PAEAU|nr:hypothetical protein AAU01_16470 [Paenarthrobacter aurescens]